MILLPTVDRHLEVYVDADFAGNWDPKETEDKDTARSRHGYLIYYAGCGTEAPGLHEPQPEPDLFYYLLYSSSS
jgi:hypothetical protein